MAERRSFRANVAFYPGVAGGVFLLAVACWLAALTFDFAGRHRLGANADVLLVVAIVAGIGAKLRRAARARASAAPSLDRAADVHVDRGDLVVVRARSRRRVARADVRSAYVVAGGAAPGARLVLAGRFGTVAEAWMPDVDDARALLAELGMGALDRPVTFAFFFGLRVTVGVDGVVVALPLLRRRRFVPHRRIDDVRWSKDRVTLLLVDGERYEIETSGGADHAALVERLLAARAAYRAHAARDGAEPLAALARAGRSAEAWVKELRALSEAAGSHYRAASLPTETLWRIALDPAETEELRIGAGLALRPGLDDGGRAKLRAAAEAAASPRVRVALDAAATEDDDASIAAAIEPPRKVSSR